MKKILMIAALGTAAATGSAHAQDAAKGEREFLKCRACHSIVSPSGETIQRGGKVGPNLYGVIGRKAGSEEDYNGYSDSMKQAGEAGLVWDEEHFATYVQDPTAFLKAYLDDPKARGKMTFKLNSGVEDVYAYLVSVAE